MTANKPVQGLFYLVMSLVALAMIFPFVWMVASSFKPAEEVLANPLQLVSSRFTFEAFEKISVMAGQSIWRYGWNSLWITLGSTVLTIVVASMGAYALYRKPGLPGFRIIEVVFLFSIMYPGILLLMPLYVISNTFGMLGTYTGIIIVITAGGGALPFFLFRQFFKKVPHELIEAAMVDGTTEWKVLRYIVAPMTLPIYGTVTLIVFMTNWGAWFPVLVISNEPATYTLATALVNMNSELGIQFQETMALSTIVTIPILVLFLLTQRRVMDGIAAGSIKG